MAGRIFWIFAAPRLANLARVIVQSLRYLLAFEVLNFSTSISWRDVTGVFQRDLNLLHDFREETGPPRRSL